MSCFAKVDGANDNKKDQLALGPDDEDDIGSRSGSAVVARDAGTSPQESAAVRFTSIAG